MGNAEIEFDSTSWHDNIIYGLQLGIGDASRGDWRHDLSFDIDFIVEWVSGGERGMQFRVAPATLTFHEVTDLKLLIDFGDSGHSTALNEPSIAGITRDAVDDPKRFPERDYYRYRIELNWPQGGEITFGARGVTQVLRASPVLFDEQRLPAGTPR